MGVGVKIVGGLTAVQSFQIMREYIILPDEGVAIFRFFGEYVGSEADRTMLKFIDALSLDEVYSFNLIIWDLSDVDSMTLHDTDGARVAQFNEEVFRKLQYPGRDAGLLLSNLTVLHIPPKDTKVKEIWLERLDRISIQPRIVPHVQSSKAENLPGLLRSLNLQRLIPMLKREWRPL